MPAWRRRAALVAALLVALLATPAAGQGMPSLQEAAMAALCPSLRAAHASACAGVDVEAGAHCPAFNNATGRSDSEIVDMLAAGNLTAAAQLLFNCSHTLMQMAAYDSEAECAWNYSETGNLTQHVAVCENYTAPVEVAESADPRACATCLLPDGAAIAGNITAGYSTAFYLFVVPGQQYVISAAPGATDGIRAELRLYSSAADAESPGGSLASSDDDRPLLLDSANARRSQIVWVANVAHNYTVAVLAQNEGEAGSFDLTVDVLPADEIWVGANRFGPTNLHAARDAMIRPDPHGLQANSKHANPTMSSPDILIWPQQVFADEGDVLEYTIVLTHPPGSTDADGVFDTGRDLVQIWLTSSQEVLQEYRPGMFTEFQGHRTQLVIETDLGTSEDYYMHNQWVGSVTGDFKTSVKADGTGEARLDFDSTNWHIPQTVRVTARQDDVYEPRVNRRGQQAYVHHRVVTPECNSPISPIDDPQKATSLGSLNATAWMNNPTCGDDHYNGFLVTDFVVSIEDDDPAVVLQDTRDPIPIEGGAPANISLKLASEPMYDVTVSLYSGPVQHPDVPVQVTFHAINSALPGVAQYRFTPRDWNTWRQFEIRAVDDDVDEWTYNKLFRNSEIGFKIESDDYYYRNNGTSCLPRDVQQVRQAVPPATQCVCVNEDPSQVNQYRPDQYNARGMQCGAIATPIDNNYRFVNISRTSCTAIEGATNCDYTVRLNSAPGFNPRDWERDLPSVVVVHLREEAVTEAEALREHELFFTEWLSMPQQNASNTTASEHAAESEGQPALNLLELGQQSLEAQQDNRTDNTVICQAFNDTVMPLINESCKVRELVTHGGTRTQDYAERNNSFRFAPQCSNQCAGLVIPYYEQCAYYNDPDNAFISDLYQSCGGKLFDGELVGLVWDEQNSDGRGGRKTFGKSPFHEYGYLFQSGWEIDLVFDHTNWDVERKISVVAFNDDVDEPNEIRTIYHTTKVEAQYQIGGAPLTDDPTYAPHNKTIEIASVDVAVIDNDIADVILGCRSYDEETQMGSIEGYAGFEGKVPRSFRFKPGENEKTGEVACIVHTQECAPKQKVEVKHQYEENWYPQNLTDPKNCSRWFHTESNKVWITRQTILDGCCSGDGNSGVDCSSGVPNTCTQACMSTYPEYYSKCWPEMNSLLQQHMANYSNVSIQSANYFQMQCSAVVTKLETGSCLPLINTLQQDFESYCCADGICDSGMPTDCRPACQNFFIPIYTQCSSVWHGADYQLNLGVSVGWVGDAALDHIYGGCGRFEGTEVNVDWMKWQTALIGIVQPPAYSMAGNDPLGRPDDVTVRLDDTYVGSLSGYLDLPVTSAGPTAIWQIEFVSVQDEGSGRDQDDWMEITVNGEMRTVRNDVETKVVFEVEGTNSVLNYEIAAYTGCHPEREGGNVADCIPDRNDALCPCPASSLVPQLHMQLHAGLARALSSSGGEHVASASNDTDSNSTGIDDADLPCTLGTYTLQLNTDPGTKRIRTIRKGLARQRSHGVVEGDARAVPHIDYSYKLVPIVIEVAPNPTPHSRFDTTHGGTSCKFTRSNWDRPCIVTIVPTMDTLLRTPYDVYWNTRSIVDHTSHTVTQSFFGHRLAGISDDYWNYTVPYQLLTPGPGPHAQDIGGIPDEAPAAGDHLSEIAFEYCTQRKGAYEEERYSKQGEDGSAGDVSSHQSGVYEEILCNWDGRRTHTEGLPLSFGHHILWKHSLYTHPVQLRYTMINTYAVPGGGAFGEDVHSTPQADPLLLFSPPIAGALRDLRLGPRLESVSDPRRCANRCMNTAGCNSFDYSPQQSRCYLNSGFIDQQNEMRMIDDMLPAGMEPVGNNLGTVSTVALSQAYYHHYKKVHVLVEEVEEAAEAFSVCQLGPHIPSGNLTGKGEPGTEQTGAPYRVVAVPSAQMSGDGGAGFCIKECCGDAEATCRAWSVRKAIFNDDRPEDDCLGEVGDSDSCSIGDMGSCDALSAACCFLNDHENSVTVPARQDAGEQASHGVVPTSGKVYQDRVWDQIRGFNYMPAYAVNAIELWYNYDPFVVERELAVAQRNGFNLVRLPLSYEFYEWDQERLFSGATVNTTTAQPEPEPELDEDGEVIEPEPEPEPDTRSLYERRLLHFVAAAKARGIDTMPVVFDMVQHPNTPRCTLHTVSPDNIDSTRKCWYPSPGYDKSDDLSWWVTYGHQYVEFLSGILTEQVPGMLLWDVVNEPEAYPPPRPDARPDMPRRPAKVPNVANASTIVGTSVAGPGHSYSVPLGEQAWDEHPWTFTEYFAKFLRNIRWAG